MNQNQDLQDGKDIQDRNAQGTGSSENSLYSGISSVFSEIKIASEKALPKKGFHPEYPSHPVNHGYDPDRIDTEAFLAGSDEAFVRLYAKYEVSLFYYCKRMLHDESAAEDAFQEIWTRVFELRNRKERMEIGHFRGLLFRSARNLCLNVLHNGHNAESIEADAEQPDFDERVEFSQAEPMTGAASGREIEALMVRALARLPFDQRETFVLHEYSGFSYPEIAEMMNVPERNVKVRAHRARIRLRKFIQGWLGLGEADDPVSYI